MTMMESSLVAFVAIYPSVSTLQAIGAILFFLERSTLDVPVTLRTKPVSHVLLRS